MFVLPDYKNNIVNISATFKKYLGKKSKFKSIKVLEKALKKNYNNVIFIICDGLGVEVLERTVPADNILRKNQKQIVTSVFPSTTTNATTSLLTAQCPAVHKWIGYSLYFKDNKKVVDLFSSTDSISGEQILPNTYKKLPIKSFFENCKLNIETYSIFPSYARGEAQINLHYNSLEEMEKQINFALLSTTQRKFLYCYCPSPDSEMHINGVESTITKNKIEEISNIIKRLSEHEDTLIVITADHGHIDVTDYVEIYKDDEIVNCLARPLSLESRATSFKIKKGKKKEFIQIFNQKYSNDFVLMSAKALVKLGIFGKTCCSRKFYDFLGDYVAIGTETNKQMILWDGKTKFKGHHTSLEKAEMQVPLIIIE